MEEKRITELNALRRRGTDRAVLHLEMRNGQMVGFLEATGSHTHNGHYVHLSCRDRFSKRSDIKDAEIELLLRERQDQYSPEDDEYHEIESTIQELYL